MYLYIFCCMSNRSVCFLCSFAGDYPAPRAVLTGHDYEVVCVSVCAELGIVISGAKGEWERSIVGYEVKRQCVILIRHVCLSEGPCLVHTITGDLLRALEGPDSCVLPRLISVSSEGHCIIYYDRGQFCNFSINGKLLAQMEINDSTRVCSQLCAGPHASCLLDWISIAMRQFIIMPCSCPTVWVKYELLKWILLNCSLFNIIKLYWGKITFIMYWGKIN